MELSVWKRAADLKLKTMIDAFSDGKGTVNMSEDLKSSELTLTKETAPILPDYLSGIGGRAKTEMSITGEASNTQTLRTAAANIVMAIGDLRPFTTPLTFRTYAAALNTPADEDRKRLYDALSELEQNIRGATTPVAIEQESSGPLYIWAAVANLDTTDPETASVPLLLAPTEEEATAL
jgi:hypothetical protein